MARPDITPGKGGRENGQSFEISWGKEEVARRLSIYGPGALLLDSVGMNAEGTMGVGRFVARGLPVRPILQGEPAVNELDRRGLYTLTDVDVLDHFDKRKDLRSFSPGIRNAAIARITADEFLRRQRMPLHLSRFTSVEFKSIVGSGAELEVVLTEMGETANDTQTFDSVITKNGKEVAKVGLEYRMFAPLQLPGSHIPPEYPIESAAQVCLLLMQKQRGLSDMDEVLPLFAGIEGVTIYQAIKIGEKVTIEASLDESDGFQGRAEVLRENGSVAQTIRGMTGIVRKREFVDKLIKRALRE